ncbi:MAG: tetratricopeptide repeat protein [Candidatus Anammoxibacter sp.]
MNILKHTKEIILIAAVAFCSTNFCFGGVVKNSSLRFAEEMELLKKMESRFDEVTDSFESFKRAGRTHLTRAGSVGSGDSGEVDIELYDEIKGLEIIRTLYEFDIYLYSVKAHQVPLGDLLEQLAFADLADISFPMVEPAILRKKMDVSLNNLPLHDILEIVSGIHGLESVLDENLDIKITIPSNLGFKSAEDYFKSKIVKNFRKVMIKYPDYEYVPESHFKLGSFFGLIGQKISAIQEFMVVAEMYPKHELAKLSLRKAAQSLADVGDLKKARDVYNEFIDRYPNDESLEGVYMAITDIWYEEEKYGVAASLYRKILEMYPLTILEPKIRERMASSYMKIGKFAEAFDTLVKLSKRRDRLELGVDLAFDAEIDFLIAECLYNMGRPEDAFVVFSSIVGSGNLGKDRLSKAMFRQAESLYKMNKFVAAIQAYRKWIKVSGEDAYGMLSVGKCLRQLNLYAKAVEILQSAKFHDTKGANNDQIRFELAMCYYDDSQYDKAIKLFTDIAINEDSPRFVDSTFYGAESLFGKEAYKDAIPHYEKLITMLDEDLDRLTHVGSRLSVCYQNLGLYSKAIDIYNTDATANN